MKTIISKFVKEQKRYSKKEIEQIFELNSEEIDGFIRNLKSYGVLKAVKRNNEQTKLSDLIDNDCEIIELPNEEDGYFYVFTYVGIITVGYRVIKCFPKYILNKDKPVKEMKQILKVISKYNSNEEIISSYNGGEEIKKYNILEIILYLISDYYEYGIYDNVEDRTVINGEGEILWEKTVNESFPIISNNRPYYMQLYTHKREAYEYDYFTRLHKCILMDCLKKLEAGGLLELFDIDLIELCEENIEDFGSKEYILYKLMAEVNIQFNTRKQILLKTIYSYLNEDRISKDNYEIIMYGTNSFNLVWEKVCSEVFNNKLNTPIGQLDLTCPVSNKYDCTMKLIDVIEKPSWIGNDNNSTFRKTGKDTLVPDIISISKDNKYTSFVILDAKYYNIELEKEKELKGCPGIGDITKQYLYQLAYQKFIVDYQIKEVKNYFLMPTDGSLIINKGKVKMEMLSDIGLQDIEIRLLPAKVMYEKFLSGRKLDAEVLKL